MKTKKKLFSSLILFLTLDDVNRNKIFTRIFLEKNRVFGYFSIKNFFFTYFIQRSKLQKVSLSINFWKIMQICLILEKQSRNSRNFDVLCLLCWIAVDKYFVLIYIFFTSLLDFFYFEKNGFKIKGIII